MLFFTYYLVQTTISIINKLFLFFIIQEQDIHNSHNQQIFNLVNYVDPANYVLISSNKIQQ